MYDYQVNYIASVAFAMLAVVLLYVAGQQAELLGVQRVAVVVAALAWASAYLAQLEDNDWAVNGSLLLTILAVVLYLGALIVLILR